LSVRGEPHLLPKASFGIALLLLVSTMSAVCGPITLELRGGSVIKGDLISWDGEQVLVKAEFGLMPFKRDQLSQATIDRLEFLSRDRHNLLSRISQLEATIKSLQQENASLRQQLQTTSERPARNPAAEKEAPVR
jgi:hypothetical protein